MIIEVAEDDFNEEFEAMPDEEEAVEDEDTDNVGEASVEINVEELIREFESNALGDAICRGSDAKHRLEELMELRRAKLELEDFDDYDV
jgi:hypothetical protein